VPYFIIHLVQPIAAFCVFDRSAAAIFLQRLDGQTWGFGTDFATLV
jgi:hypothetical protein